MSVEPSTPQGADAGEDVTTEQLLSMLRDQQKRLSKLEGENNALQDRIDELEAENSDLRDRVDDLESVVEAQESVLFRGDGKDIDTLFIGGIPVGKVVDGNNEARRRLNRTVFGNPAPEMSKHEVDAVVDEHGTVIEALSQGLGGGTSQSAPSQAARSKMLEIHRKLADFQDGADTALSANVRRGVRLFRRFIQKLDPDKNETGVELSHGKYKMGGKRARQILDSDGDLPSSGASKTVDRAMGHVVGKSYFPGQECECAKDDCEHTMFSQSTEDGYTLSVDRETWESYLETVAAAADEDVSVGVTDDDGENPSEDPGQDTTEELDQLMNADAANDSADTVVSGSEASVSGGE